VSCPKATAVSDVTAAPFLAFVKAITATIGPLQPFMPDFAN